MTFFVRTLSAASVAMLFVQPVQAAYNLTLTQDGPNVVVTGSGMIDLAGLTFGFSASTSSGIDPPDESMITGAFGVVDAYGAITSPGSFGGGAVGTLANSGVGDLVGTYETTLYVPTGYMSGGALSDSATYNNATYASLGVTPGTYVWTWGSGANADNLTLVIGEPSGTVPEPSTWVMMLLGFGLLGYAGFYKRFHVQ